MVAVTVAALCVCLVAVCVLAYAVWQLRSRVDALVLQAAPGRGGDISATYAGHPSGASPGGMPVVDVPVGAAPVRTVPVVDGRQGTSAAGTMRGDPSPVTTITALSGASGADVEVPVSRVASVTLATPLVKVAAFSHGVRRALDDDSRMRIAHAMRRELKSQRKMRRRRRSRRAPSQETTP